MNRPGSQRGVTLIEMVVAIGLSLLIIVMMTGSMFNQQESYYRQLSYVEAQQNARASIAMLKRYVRDAGFGFVPDIGAEGIMPVGTCFVCADISDPDLANVAASCADNVSAQTACDNVDPDLNGETVADDPNAGVDRLRVVRIDSDGFVPRNPETIPAGPGAIVPVADSTASGTYSPHPFTGGNFFAVISGKCTGGTPVVANELLEMGPDGGPTLNSMYTYTMTGTPSTCAVGFDTQFSFGPAQVADFFIHHGTDGHPRLMMRLGVDRDLDEAYVVAHDIEDLQVVYGVDTGVDSPASTTPDGKVNADEGTASDDWCDDLTDATCAGGFSTDLERRARVQAVRVAVVTRTRDPIGTAATTSVDVENHQVTGIADGYRRWVYRATIALRNNDL